MAVTKQFESTRACFILALAICAGFAWSSPRATRSDNPAPEVVYLPPLTVSTVSASQPAHTLRIMALGDSITYGAIEEQRTDRVFVDCGGGYRPVLWSALKRDGISVEPVGSVNVGDSDYNWHCEAHPGATTADFAANYAVWDRNIHPDVVLCQLGTNDPGNALPLTATMRYSASLWQQIISANPRVLLLVATVTPSRGHGSEPNHQRFAVINDGLRRQVTAWAARGYNIRLVDMDRECGLTVSDFGHVIGLHPNEAGYRKMAEVWRRNIESTLQPSPLHTPFREQVALNEPALR